MPARTGLLDSGVALACALTRAPDWAAVVARVCLVTTCIPFIVQIWTWSLLGFRNNRSLLPFPMKSPARTSCQDVPGLPTSAMLTILVPFISQMATSPLLLFCHRMSAVWSPLTSPVPTRRHDEGGVVRTAELTSEVPFISQML